MKYLIALLLLFIGTAHADMTVTTTPGSWDFYKGTSKVASFTTEADCYTAAKTYTTGLAVGDYSYTCRTITKVVVSVPPPPTGSATLSWSAPVSKADAGVLDNLAGYRIYYGTASGSYSAYFAVPSPLALSATVNKLTLNTLWFFAIVALDTNGSESLFGYEVSKLVTVPTQ